MMKEVWIRHIEETEGIRRPTQGGDRDAWEAAVFRHTAFGCPECIKRARTVRRNRSARMKHETLTGMGLTRVRGALGGTYYE
jgi:hypothetical protein